MTDAPADHLARLPHTRRSACDLPAVASVLIDREARP